MRVKGTAVKSIPEFIKATNSGLYQEWLNNLPTQSKKIFSETVNVAEWYSIEDAIIIPTKAMSMLLYNNNTKGAWECGRYSAKTSLTGIYKLYVKMASPNHIIERATRILQAYYEPSELKVVHVGKKSVILHIIKFPRHDFVIDARLAGWMEQALELSGCKNVDIKIPKTFSKGDMFSEFNITWD